MHVQRIFRSLEVLANEKTVIIYQKPREREGRGKRERESKRDRQTDRQIETERHKNKKKQRRRRERKEKKKERRYFVEKYARENKRRNTCTVNTADLASYQEDPNKHGLD